MQLREAASGLPFCSKLPSSQTYFLLSKPFAKHCFGGSKKLHLFHGCRIMQKPYLIVEARSSNRTHENSATQKPVSEVEHGEVLLSADMSSSAPTNQTAAVSASPRFPPSQLQVGSPLLWVGVGVAISVVFSWAAKKVQAYALQQALKSVVQQSKQGSNQFGGMSTVPSGPFPFPFAALQSASPAAFSPVAEVAASTVPSGEAKEEVENKREVKKPAFTDVNIDLLEEDQPTSKVAPEKSEVQTIEPITSYNSQVIDPQVSDGASSSEVNSSRGPSATSTNGRLQSFMSVETLEKMLDDPQVQKMIFPYLPEELRDPVTFKNMIQLPPVRQQLQDALNNMGGEFGPDMMKYMNNDVVKQQFEQLGLTPEEVVGKILANPGIAASLQNSRVVDAIMDCSQNPLNITKYQNDKEVMDALFKIAELFPGAASTPF